MNDNQAASKCRSRKIKYDFEWIIERFSKTTNFVDSETFSLTDQTKWYLRLFPDGVDAKNKGYVSIYIEPKELLCNTTVDIELKLISSSMDKTIIRSSKDTTIESVKDCRGWARIIPRHKLLNESNGFLLNDTLKIHFEMSISLDAPPKRNDRVLVKQQALLESGEFNDCVLHCTNGEISANKTFLASQSSVFRAMFNKNSNTEEAKTGVVKITDVRKEIMQVLVTYASNGHLPKDLDSIMDDLLSAADKYDFEDVKSLCIQRMSETLTQENVCNFCMLAFLHNIENLKNIAIEFLRNNKSSIRHELLDELFDFAVERKENVLIKLFSTEQ